MAHNKFDATALVTSPMINTSLLLPKVLLEEIDKAATRDDPSSPNRSSWMRRALIDPLKREAA
jgi:metal-responsive CopG/Arc/MetJ family transcriptional regulator